MTKNEPDVTETITNEALDDTEDDSFVSAEGVEPEPLTTFPTDVEEVEAEEPEPVEDVIDMTVVRDKVHRAGPFTVDGFNVYDNKGQRVAMAGTDQNRSASGPMYAAAIAEALNKMGRR